MKKHKKMPWLAVLLSLIAPGLGQAYAGKYDRGLLIAALTLVLCAFAMVMFLILGGFVPSVVPTAPWYVRMVVYDFIWYWSFFGLVYLWVLYDAYRSAK